MIPPQKHGFYTAFLTAIKNFLTELATFYRRFLKN